MTEEKPAPLSIPQTAADWQAMLETLFPSRTHELHDLAGNAYTVRTVLSARRETELIRILAKVSDLPVKDWAASFQTANADPRSSIEGLLSLVRHATSDGRVLDLLDEAFCMVFRPTVDLALANVQRDAADLLTGIEKPSAVDIFDTVEMIQALLPFVARSASKILTVVQKATANKAARLQEN